jgi:thymidine kinase
MAKLYFYYASMNAGKSTILLQTDFNYRERGMGTMLWTAGIHDRSGFGVIDSRIGIKASGETYGPETDMRGAIETELKKRAVNVVLIDEAQFLTRDQVFGLAGVCDELDVPVLCYGLRTDFQGNLFEGSATLLALADKLVELKAICECGRKATMNLRVDSEGRAVRAGAHSPIGGKHPKQARCPRHFMARLKEAEARQLSLGLADAVAAKR